MIDLLVDAHGIGVVIVVIFVGVTFFALAAPTLDTFVDFPHTFDAILNVMGALDATVLLTIGGCLAGYLFVGRSVAIAAAFGAPALGVGTSVTALVAIASFSESGRVTAWLVVLLIIGVVVFVTGSIVARHCWWQRQSSAANGDDVPSSPWAHLAEPMRRHPGRFGPVSPPPSGDTEPLGAVNVVSPEQSPRPPAPTRHAGNRKLGRPEVAEIVSIAAGTLGIVQALVGAIVAL